MCYHADAQGQLGSPSIAALKSSVASDVLVASTVSHYYTQRQCTVDTSCLALVSLEH